MQLGTREWAHAVCAAVNESDAYREAAAGWRWPLSLCFEGEGDVATGYVRFDLQDGRCRGADVCDREAFGDSPFRISGPYARWGQVLEGGVEPMKALLLRRLRLEGDLLTAMRYLPAAKALIECASGVETDVPSR